MGKDTTKKSYLMTKKALVQTIIGDSGVAKQFLRYEDIVEVKMNVKEFEIYVLTKYDDAYIRVFSLDAKNIAEADKKKATLSLHNFYNQLQNRVLDLDEDEVYNLQAKRFIEQSEMVLNVVEKYLKDFDEIEKPEIRERVSDMKTQLEELNKLMIEMPDDYKVQMENIMSSISASKEADEKLFKPIFEELKSKAQKRQE